MRRLNYISFVAIGTLFLLISGCSANKAKNDSELKKYYDAKNVDGCFTMINNADGEITVYNMALDTARLLPASTFKILNSLIGLQTGVISSDSMVIKWDGVKRENTDWNKNLTMKEAFKVSAVPYYQEVARRVGLDTMKIWVDSIGYGNKLVTGPVDSFWLNNTLKISPDEQLGFMKKLYFDQLPFLKTVQQIVRNAMLQEANTLYKLSYKTGLGYNEEGLPVGWVVGWIEENNHVYFFANLVKGKTKDDDIKVARLAITKDILKDYGFFEGKK